MSYPNLDDAMDTSPETHCPPAVERQHCTDDINQTQYKTCNLQDNTQPVEEGGNSKTDGPANIHGAPELCDPDSSVSCMDHNLTIVLFGSSVAVQFQHDNMLLGEMQPDIENRTIPRIVPLQMKISGHHVSLINLIGLHETALDLDLLTGQLVNENKIIAFIFVVRMGQLTDADKMGIEWLQRVFGDRVLQFVMILFTYESEEESDSIIDDLKKNSALELLIEKCGGRYHTCSKNMNKLSEMRDLMNRIEHLFIENEQLCYTGGMYNSALKKREDMQDRTCPSDDEHTRIKNITTTETRESHKGKSPDQCLNQEVDQKMNDLFRRLHLKGTHEHTLRAADVLQLTVHSLQSHETCAEEDLIQTFLQKLLMMDYKARYIMIKNEQDFIQQKDFSDSSEDERDIFIEMSLHNNTTSESDPVDPMDVQMAVFHCADSFLKQLMVTKLSQCQYALPLLVPDPFTKEIEFPLWTFRQINKSWKMKDTNNEIISDAQSVWKVKTPMVFFFRFGSLCSSKSQLMNGLINEKHNTFFHRNCTGSSKTRILMDGVVEIAWYCPSGKEADKFNQCVAFCNLHGDAGDHEKQLQILTEMASVNVVILPQPDKHDKSAPKIQNLLKGRKPLICLFTEDESTATKMTKGKYKIGLKGRNQSSVSVELRRAINNCLSKQDCIFRLEDVSKHPGIRVDEEHDNDCKRGKEAAQQMMDLLKKKDLTEIKELFLPCQGELWNQWCKKNKELHRFQGNEIDMEISRKQKEMKTIREQQHDSVISEFTKLFIKEMKSDDTNKKLYFLKWLIIFLDEHTSADLSALQQKYNKNWLKLKENNEQVMKRNLTDEQTEVERISEELQAATFGLEHILREIGQIYESCKSVNKNKEGLLCDFSSLPSLAADMMISGFPLELMDGDAAHVPVVWVTAVLHELIKKLGDKRVFVLSVLGIQSSGKSTMLNAMFGLQFAVSAGRCTRGAFMQLIGVSEEIKVYEKLKFDYILVVDTEGLRALELSGRSTRHQDNEMATFVVGLGNLTLINIFGESPSELQEILQIVVQAFMRMKKVKLNPSCMFVHQNVSEVTAGEKNMEGRRRLQETLDEMTKLAAKDEVCDAECFNDVISFDIRKDVKYFAQLWEGSPPMAPPNPSYCENIQELKTTLFSHLLKSDGLDLTQLKDRINDLWEALLDERFVFSFRNSLEIATYRKLETEYSKCSWSLRSAMLEIENKLYNNIENETIDEVSESDLQGKLKGKSGEVEKSMSEFFEKDKDKDILVQWKASFYIKIKELQENGVRETTRKLNEILQQRDAKKRIDAQKTRHENILFEKSKELAIKLKDKAKDETILKKEFDTFWKECVKKIEMETTPIQDINVLKDMKQLLNDIYESVPVNAWIESRDIFSVLSYTDYLQSKKSSETTGNAFRSAREKFEDENQIRTLVNDIAQHTDKMIMSYNIAKIGYNKTYIQELAKYIKARVDDYEQGSRKYVFTKDFYMDLVISICNKENQVITDQHRMFREANDPVFYFEKKSKEYYSIFQKYCQGATSAAIFGEIICQKLKEPIQKSVYKDTAIDLTNEIKTKCESLNGNRSKLEKHILKTLAEQEDFNKYINYIFSPKDHFKSFIRDEVNRYITDNFGVCVRPKMKENIKLLQQKVMAAAHKATILVTTTSGDVQKWLDHFTLQLSDVLIFSVKDLRGVSHDGVDDFNLLEDVICEELGSVSSEIQNKFSKDTFPENLEHKDRPDEILIDHLSECCWVQCPFCAATCTNTVENHTGDHSVPFHRVDGLTGCCYEDTECLSADFCSTLERSGKKFYTGQWIPCREYRKAGGVYAEWSITPDFSELPYWKWFVCRFHKELEDYFDKIFHRWEEISFEWMQYSREQAIKSLDEYI